MPSPVLATEDLAIARGRRRLVDGATLAVEPADVVHLAGANGAGKTTTLRVLAGLTRPAGGKLRRGGMCAFVPEKVVLTAALRCGEWLEAMRRLRGGGGRVDWATEVAAAGLDPAVLARASGTLSKGMLQRVALIEALAARPTLLLLDEPFSGLDADGRAWLARRLAAHRADGGAAVLTDHSASSSGHVTAGWRLADGALVVDTAPAAPVAVRVVAAARDGEHSTHRAAPGGATNDLLTALIADGWTIDEVTRG